MNRVAGVGLPFFEIAAVGGEQHLDRRHGRGEGEQHGEETRVLRGRQRQHRADCGEVTKLERQGEARQRQHGNTQTIDRHRQPFAQHQRISRDRRH